MAEFDRSSKWLIQHHGDAMLRLAGVTGIESWRALQAEVVQPTQLPDGLLEVRLADQPEPALFVLEIATYPERRLEQQLLRDMLLVYLQRRVLPEVIALVLHPKGKLRARNEVSIATPTLATQLSARWRVVELWTLAADDLLATREPGLMPWVPLTTFDGPPEPVIRECREVIETAPLDDRANLLAVTQVLTRLRYNVPQLLELLGGASPMIESPLLDEIRAEGRLQGMRNAVKRKLQLRFGLLPASIEASLLSVRDDRRLEQLLDEAYEAASLEDFKASLGA